MLFSLFLTIDDMADFWCGREFFGLEDSLLKCSKYF
jgi:hypothetical protein